MKSIIQERIISARNFRISRPYKYEGQVRSGHNICCSSCVVLSKTAINHCCCFLIWFEVSAIALSLRK